MVLIVPLPGISKLKKLFKLSKSRRRHGLRLPLGRRCSVLEEEYLWWNWGCRQPTLGLGLPEGLWATHIRAEEKKKTRSTKEKQVIRIEEHKETTISYGLHWNQQRLRNKVSHPRETGSSSSCHMSWTYFFFILCCYDFLSSSKNTLNFLFSPKYPRGPFKSKTSK